jgi:glycyl-tRNA synthetase beta chain
LAARFRDAGFFWQTDQRLSLDERIPLLEKTVFIASLGSYRQKLERVQKLAAWLASHAVTEGRRADIPSLTRAAELSKSDLTTDMVAEFPELQGVVGGLYARRQGEDEKVWKAIYHHYQPAGPEDSLPETPEGALLALADKLDTLVGCFAVGLAPTGSRDPLALRRAAAGVLRIIIEARLSLSISHSLESALLILEQTGLHPKEATLTSIHSFLEERARYLFREQRGFSYDEVNATLAAGWDDLLDSSSRLNAIRRIRPTPDFDPVATGFKRIRNILEQAGREPGVSNLNPVDQALLEPGAERELFERFCALREKVGSLRQQKRYEEALRTIASIRPQVDNFFDKVLVMTPNQTLRQNRLNLLACLLQEFTTIADFSQIVIRPKSEETL